MRRLLKPGVKRREPCSFVFVSGTFTLAHGPILSEIAMLLTKVWFDVPTLFRFLAVLAILSGLGFAGLVALVTFVEPQQREFSEILPPSRLNK